MVNKFQFVLLVVVINVFRIESGEESKVLELLPKETKLEELNQNTEIYFDRIDFDILKIKKNKKSTFEKGGIEGILFVELANKPYFDNKFKNEICSHDSLAKYYWKEMRKKLEGFKSPNMLINFDKITLEDSDKTFYLPTGLILIKEGGQFLWYLPIGWEYKDVSEIVQKISKKASKSNCLMLGHILGHIYNFDFSKLLYSFRCG